MKSSLNLSYSYEDIMTILLSVKKKIYKYYFSSQDIVTSFSIFDPKLYPKSPNDMYVNEEIKHFCITMARRELPFKTIANEQFTMPATISSDLSTEWKKFCHY